MDSSNQSQDTNFYRLGELSVKEDLSNLLATYITHTDKDASQEKEFQDHVVSMMNTLTTELTLIFGLFVLITWPFDYVMFDSADLIDSLFFFRLITFLFVSWLYLTQFLSSYFRRRIKLVVSIFLVVYFGLLGMRYGMNDALQSKFLFLSAYMLPPIFTIPILLYFFERFLLILTNTGAFFTTYLLGNPVHMNDDYFYLYIFVTSGLMIAGMLLGHIFFHLYRNYFFEVLREKRDREHLRDAFSRFITSSVMDDVLDNPERLELGGEDREISVLYADIEDFTTFSEHRSANEVATILNTILEKMTDSVLEYDGVVDKYLGDGLVAEFGILPMEPMDHAARACGAALNMQDKFASLNVTENKEWEFDFRIGLHTGMATTGNMGTEERFDFTAVGDTMNIGSRLEGVNKIYDTNCIISRHTYRKSSDDLVVRELDKIKVYGKEEPITIYELLGNTEEDAERYQQLIDTYEEALWMYRNMNWSEAKSKFEAVLVNNPEDSPSKVFIKRIKNFMETPPPTNWDGSIDLTSKPIT